MVSNTKEQTKVSGITPNLVEQLKNTSPFAVFIIEADGAKCLPIKVPFGHEPCVPINSDMVILAASTHGKVLVIKTASVK
nr:hypothetical protein [Photobacterium profundum]